MTHATLESTRKAIDTPSGRISAATHPEPIRTLTLTNGDVHDNWPPTEFAGSSTWSPRAACPARWRECWRTRTTSAPLSLWGRPTSGPRASQTRDLERFILAFDNRRAVRLETPASRTDPRNQAASRIEGARLLFTREAFPGARPGVAAPSKKPLP